MANPEGYLLVMGLMPQFPSQDMPIVYLMPSFTAWHAALSSRILKVLSVCAKKEMGRIDTRPIITAGAIVEYPQAIRDRAVVNLIGQTMRVTVSPTMPQMPISNFTNSPLPEPTTFGLSYLCPKVSVRCTRPTMPVNEGAIFTCVKRSNLSTAARAQLRAVKRQLDNFWYNLHTNASLKVLVNPRPSLEARGLFVTLL